MVLPGLLMLSACVWTQKVTMPPISLNPTGVHHIGRFVWFDLLTEDMKVAQNFYTELFGWRFSAAEGTPDYTIIYSGDKPIGGMLPYESRDAKVKESIWLSAMSVEDVNQVVSEVESHNGTVLDGPMDVEGRGMMAVISDPEGAELVLIRAAGGDPTDSDVRAGEFLWVDLFTRDAGKAREFYNAIAGYSAGSAETESGHSYNLLRRDGRACAGIVELPFEDVEPNWLPYIKVDDVNATMRRAAELGGIVILRLEHIAVIEDPTGGVFGIQMVRGDES